MKKLIELLNEYIPKGWSIEHGGKSVFYEGLNYNDRIISKEFGFIKWLVDNDKIDLEKLRDLDISDNFNYEYFNKNKSDFLISLLSISDNPIELLLSVLK